MSVPIFIVRIYCFTILTCICLYRYCGASSFGVFYVGAITVKVPYFASTYSRGIPHGQASQENQGK